MNNTAVKTKTISKVVVKPTPQACLMAFLMVCSLHHSQNL